MAELDSSQLDCVILGQIGAHHFSGKLTGHCPKVTPRRPLSSIKAIKFASRPFYSSTTLVRNVSETLSSIFRKMVLLPESMEIQDVTHGMHLRFMTKSELLL